MRRVAEARSAKGPDLKPRRILDVEMEPETGSAQLSTQCGDNLGSEKTPTKFGRQLLGQRLHHLFSVLGAASFKVFRSER